jgi:hypothetical protein
MKKLTRHQSHLIFAAICIIFLGCESKYSEPPVEGIKKSENNLQKAADNKRVEDQQFNNLKKRLATGSRVIDAIANYRKADYGPDVERTKAVIDLLKTTGTRFESIVPVNENGVSTRNINILVPTQLKKDFPCESIDIQMKSKQISNEKRAFEYVTSGCKESDEKTVLLKGEISNTDQKLELPIISSIANDLTVKCTGGLSQTGDKNDLFSCDKLALPLAIDGQKYTLNSFSVITSDDGNDKSTVLKLTNENLEELAYELNRTEILNLTPLKKTNSREEESHSNPEAEKP